MKIFLPLVLTIIFITNCNYKYYLGTVYENQSRFEESYENYQKALFESPNNNKFDEARIRVGEEVIKDLILRYQNLLDRNELFQAYHLLNLALSINNNVQYFNEELINWYRIVLIGKLDFDFKNLKQNYNWLENMKITADFHSPNQTNIVRSQINETTGFFIVEDLLYKPTFSFVSFYSLKNIGIRFTDYVSIAPQIPTAENGNNVGSTSVASQEFIPLIDFSKIRVDRAVGDFNWENYDKKGIINDSSIPKFEDKQYFYSKNIVYSTNLLADEIEINTVAKTIPFLPHTLFLNNEHRFFLLDFGNLNVSFSNQNGWGVKRHDLDNNQRIDFLLDNLIYRPFTKFNGNYFTFNLIE